MLRKLEAKVPECNQGYQLKNIVQRGYLTRSSSKLLGENNESNPQVERAYDFVLLEGI